MKIERLENEKSFHDKRFSGDDGDRKAAKKYYDLGKEMRARYLGIVSENCRDKKLLEYGCGSGSNSATWLGFGAIVTGIDISPEGIKRAQDVVADFGQNADFRVMNAEAMDFEDRAFDLVVGTGIIHHLDLKRAYSELRRVLKPDGHAVFIEPLGHNPFINLYRRLTPAMRTEDEHPLKWNDLNALKTYFQEVEIECFTFFTFGAIPFRRTLLFGPLYKLFAYFDRCLFTIPLFRRFAWTAIIHAQKPMV